MATEATLEKSADAPSTAHSETVLDSEAAAQNVDPKLSVLNGGKTADELENKRITTIEEQNQSTDVSVSGGSDTEAFKTDASTSQPDDKGHARTTSTVKKPATFKAVSVNKTFLASKGGSGAAVSKPGDKSPAAPGTPGSQLPQSAVLSSRPRLIAKTGGGSRDSTPGFASNGGKAAAAPDPNTVWNKNRPVPTPEPKKLSDEELKKYGIHMATRLQSEDKQGQSNWADIDDDDEDWAPEAITWTDGTKSTLPQVDESQIQAPDPTPVAPIEAPVQPTAAGIPSEEEAVEYQKRLMKEKREEAIKRRLEEEAREEAAKAERIRLKLEAMGPAPDRKSAKKEGSSSQDVSSPATTSIQPAATAVASTTGHADTQLASQPSEQASQSADTPLTGAVPPGQTKADLEVDTATQLGPPGSRNPSQPALWDGSAQAPSRFSSWPSSTQPSRNVWGSPNNDRGLGNGTFNPDLGRVPETRTAAVAQTQAKGPAPIAPPSSSRVLNRNQQPGQVYPASKGDRFASTEPRPYSDRQNQWVSAVLQSDAALRDQQVKERQELDQRRADQGLSVEQAQPAIKHTWRAESAASRMEAGSRAGAPSWDQKLEDRSKQTIPASTHDGLAANGVIGAGSSSLLAPGSSTSSHPRLSRFFPSKDKDSRSEAHAHAEGERSESPSPPPPTMDDHPVYDGDASHPHVSLPRPQPVVKLPPARGATSGLVRGQRPESGLANAGASSYKSNQISAAGSVQSAQHTGVITQSTPPQSQQQWQEKIYELTGRRAAPKSPGVESASRSALDQPTQQQPATVSLPTHMVVRETGGATSKPMAEECFEEQEMGSLPPVRIPHNVPAAAWQLALPPVKSFPRGFAVLSTTVKHLDLSDLSKPFIRISLPNMSQAKELPYHRSSSRANSRGSGHGRAGGRHRGSGASYRGGSGAVGVVFGTPWPRLISREIRRSLATTVRTPNLELIRLIAPNNYSHYSPPHDSSLQLC
ncbi:uncharacterized protein DNG_05885 [Cephalotrichum gorgonifer]|uniref:Uncharacterized protein n=1 Tax=Cephalotrichum gorgonifer TaxID=2041049 RepID=A0AAE8N193_9PEZI|nr:uncharacterized protein DNG_05885 [Cephalotrichum gorgonifer]